MTTLPYRVARRLEVSAAIVVWASMQPLGGFTTSEAVCGGLGLRPDGISPSDVQAAGHALSAAGWRRVSVKRGGSVVKGWRREAGCDDGEELDRLLRSLAATFATSGHPEVAKALELARGTLTQ